MFKLKIETDNAAFDNKEEVEVCRILREIADKIEGGRHGGFVIDINGSVVGEYSLE